mmetsp:Transcript_91953/g.264559  ORF Transcript_91953/g.264559 Transcript_91953/m.264559 type:complete len:217 (-) Transcript_91953:267-917(-)
MPHSTGGRRKNNACGYGAAARKRRPPAQGSWANKSWQRGVAPGRSRTKAIGCSKRIHIQASVADSASPEGNSCCAGKPGSRKPLLGACHQPLGSARGSWAPCSSTPSSAATAVSLARASCGVMRCDGFLWSMPVSNSCRPSHSFRKPRLCSTSKSVRTLCRIRSRPRLVMSSNRLTPMASTTGKYPRSISPSKRPAAHMSFSGPVGRPSRISGACV